jgi:hypothetical protein
VKGRPWLLRVCLQHLIIVASALCSSGCVQHGCLCFRSLYGPSVMDCVWLPCSTLGSRQAAAATTPSAAAPPFTLAQLGRALRWNMATVSSVSLVT